MTWWILPMAVAGALAIGVLIGRGTRRVEGALWRKRAVEMVQMNNVLMDRLEVLEAERQKE